MAYKYPAWERKAVKDKWRRLGNRAYENAKYLAELREDYSKRKWSDEQLKNECISVLSNSIVDYRSLSVRYQWMLDNLSGG